VVCILTLARPQSCNWIGPETAGSTKLIWSWSRRMRSASPTERNYPNAEIVMHENEPAYWFDDEKCKGHQPGAEIVLSGWD